MVPLYTNKNLNKQDLGLEVEKILENSKLPTSTDKFNSSLLKPEYLTSLSGSGTNYAMGGDSLELAIQRLQNNKFNITSSDNYSNKGHKGLYDFAEQPKKTTYSVFENMDLTKAYVAPELARYMTD